MHNLIDLGRIVCTDCLQSWPTDIDPNLFDCDRYNMMCWADMSRGFGEGVGHDWERNQSFAECADCDAHVAGV
jgi:hypothetical protein